MTNPELIISEKGQIYHLNLRAEDVADTIITVGDPARVPLVSQHFDKIDLKSNNREFVAHTGYIGSKRITVISSGIGPDNIDIVLNELDALVNLNLSDKSERIPSSALNIFRLGTSGALQKDISPGSLVVSTFGIGLDNLLHYYRYEPNAEESFLLSEFQHHSQLNASPITPYVAEASIRLLNQFGSNFIHGITVTCPGFYAPQGRSLRMTARYPLLPETLSGFRSGSRQITNFEMETSALYGLGKLMGHHCLSVNTIIANRISGQFLHDHAKAVEKMILSSLDIIASIPG